MSENGVSCGIMANMLVCIIVVSEFKLYSYYYVHFQTNTLGKGMNAVMDKGVVNHCIKFQSIN